MRKTYLIAITALSLLLVVACMKEDIMNSSSFVETNDYLTVADAQKFFEKEITRSLATRSSAKSAGLTPGEFTPDWTRAKTSQNEEIGSVDIPINAQYIYRAVRSELKKGKASVYQVALSQKLVVEKNKQNGRLFCYVLTLLPDKEFYTKNKDNIGDRFINSGEKGRFSGICVYSLFRSNIAVRMDRYADGKMTEHLDLSRSINDPMDIHTSKIKEFLGGIRVNRQVKVSTRAWGEGDDGGWYWEEDDPICSFCGGFGCASCNGVGDDYCPSCGRIPCWCGGEEDSYNEPLVPIRHNLCGTVCSWFSMDDDLHGDPMRLYCPKCGVNFWY